MRCQLLSEMQEEAVLRLVAYTEVDDSNFANARFLGLTLVKAELAAETSLRKMEQDLNDAFEKQGIGMTVFKSNQFSALSVYYAQFVTQTAQRYAA